MSRRPRRNHSPDFKAKVVFAALRGDHTLAELSAQFDIHANQILDWKNQLLNQSARIFESATSKPEPDVYLKALHAKIGYQALQIDFLESALSKAGIPSVRK